MAKLMLLDVDGTREDFILNGTTDEDISKSLNNLDKIFLDIELGIETSIIKLDNSYITTTANANWYRETYGWIFSVINIEELV